MNLTIPPPVAAFGRHVLSYSMGAVTAAAALHVVSSSDAQNLGNALTQISTGVQTIMGGLATITSFGMGLYASWSATKTSQLKAVAANPEVTSVVVSTPAVAATVPSNKVVPQ